MLPTSLSLLVISVLARAPIAMAECGEPVPSGIVMINETSYDVAIFRMNSPGAIVTFRVKPFMADYLGDLDYYFAIRVQSKVLTQLIVKLPIDLDRNLIVERDGRPAQQFLINLICTDLLDGEVTQYHRTLSVTAVDEFETIFPYGQAIRIPEDTPPLSSIASLSDMVIDGDFEQISYDVTFSVTAFENNTVTSVKGSLIWEDGPPRDSITISLGPTAIVLDGRQLFSVDHTGVLSLIDFLDFEKGDKLYNLNVTVIRAYSSPTVAGQTAFSNLHGVVSITILNVNDNPVEFVYSGCGVKCPIAYYITEMTPTFTGILTNIKYGPTYAIDLDGDHVEYSLIGGSPRSYTSLFEINQGSGNLTVRKLLEDEKIALLTLIIQASAYSTLHEKKYQKPADKAYSFVIISVQGRRFPFYDFTAARFAYSGSERNVPKPYCTLLVVLLMAAVSL